MTRVQITISVSADVALIKELIFITLPTRQAFQHPAFTRTDFDQILLSSTRRILIKLKEFKPNMRKVQMILLAVPVFFLAASLLAPGRLLAVQKQKAELPPGKPILWKDPGQVEKL
ncbi:MAG: hypothetical protein SF097_02585 [Acidobacteriota bacterium]|nr:hypothetical protein [Acidobacteriota bacterium]